MGSVETSIERSVFQIRFTKLDFWTFISFLLNVDIDDCKKNKNQDGQNNIPTNANLDRHLIFI